MIWRRFLQRRLLQRHLATSSIISARLAGNASKMDRALPPLKKKIPLFRSWKKKSILWRLLLRRSMALFPARFSTLANPMRCSKVCKRVKPESWRQLQSRAISLKSGRSTMQVSLILRRQRQPLRWMIRTQRSPQCSKRPPLLPGISWKSTETTQKAASSIELGSGTSGAVGIQSKRMSTPLQFRACKRETRFRSRRIPIPVAWRLGWSIA